MVLQLYAGAVGRGVDVHCDGMRLQLDLLGDAGGAQAVQTQSWTTNWQMSSQTLIRQGIEYWTLGWSRPILLNCSSFKLQILQLLLSLLWNFSWFKKPNDPLLTSRWSLLKCLSFKKNFASEKGILSELEPKQDSGFSLNLQISDF